MHSDAARFAYNLGLDLVSNPLATRRDLVVLAMTHGAGRTDAEAWAEETVVPLPWELPAPRGQWSQAKGSVVPWWAKYSKESHSSDLDPLARALDASSKG